MPEPITPATPAAPQAPGAPAPAAAGVTPEPPKPGDPADVFKSEESKNAVLADLAKERDARQALTTELAEFKTSNEARNKALAEALGLTEAPKSEDLAETVKALQKQITDSQLESSRLRIAAEHKIPAEHHNLLTETDTERLTAQAAQIAKLLEASATPAFQSNPGQGQQAGDSSLDAQIAEATQAGNFAVAIALKEQRHANSKTKS